MFHPPAPPADPAASAEGGSRFIGALLNSAATHRLFATRDLDEARHQVGRVMKPHHLELAGRAQRLDARMHHVAFGQVSLSRLHYGAEVDIRPGPLGDFYLVQMPLAGHARIASGRQGVDSTTELASVLSPDAATAMRWSADNDQLMVRIARPLVDRAVAARLGTLDRPSPARPVEFALGLRWRECAAWHCLVAYLVDCAAQGVNAADHPLMAAQIEQLAAATLVSWHPHDHAGERPTPPRALLPRHVRRVQEHLHAHAGEPLTPEALAALAGVSLRSLYAGFKAHCGVSPMQYLKDLRLDRAQADLQAAAPGARVADIALRWGFGHLGRFSIDYKARFGTSPSETLRRG